MWYNAILFMRQADLRIVFYFDKSVNNILVTYVISASL